MLEGFAFQLACDEAVSRVGFNPADLRPIDLVSKVSVPALFGVGANDTLTLPHHTRELYSQWSGPKQFHTFQGDHNCDRPAWFLAKAAGFLWENFQTEATDKDRRSQGSLDVFPVKADGPISQMIRECLPVRVNGQTSEPFGPKIPARSTPKRVRFPSIRSDS